MRPPPVIILATFALSLGAVATVPDSASAQDTTAVLLITLTDHESGSPVAGARIEVDGGTFGAVTDTAGRARIAKIPPGSHSVSVDAFGYRAERFEAEFAPGALVETDMALLVGPIQLDPLRVLAVATEQRLRVEGFYQRERMGHGTFMPPVMVKGMADRGSRLVDALRGVLGFRVVVVTENSRSGYIVVSSRGPMGIRNRYCLPDIYLDGSRQEFMDPFEIEDFIPLSMVAAIEAYPNPATVPPRYFSGSRCGAILIWTK